MNASNNHLTDRHLPFVLSLLLALFVLPKCASHSESEGRSILVDNIEAFDAAIAAIEPGDVILLKNGNWENAELTIDANGDSLAPITIQAQTFGEVILTGQSNLSISGSHIVVRGLVFKEGYTPTSEVISFKTSGDRLCNNCRVTECVIDHFSNPERFESDYWVGIYGKNNRFDHNHLVGKGNQGVTLAVRLNSEESRANHHRIDHNYFGYRQTLGSNGGETLRIGTSHYSLENSNTLVENNYFENASGELEIISSKSCQNVFLNNTFYECQGTLTMRHGNETLVENNYFFGNRKPNTGGIRIINESQTVRGNYLQGLTGNRFRSAFAIMNGVPNSPANRYLPVIKSEASNNIFIDCDHIQFCVGADEERSTPPSSTSVSQNVFIHQTRSDIFSAFDDISGISFSNNLIDPQIKPLDAAGFSTQEIPLKEMGGLSIPFGTSAGDLIAEQANLRATKENTGVDWYPKTSGEPQFNTGKRILVAPGLNSLYQAVQEADAGDILVLTSAADYVTSKSIDLYKPISIEAADGLAQKPTLKFQKTSLFNIENGGSLSLKGLKIDGQECRDKAGNTVIRTSRYSMNRNYKLFIEDCTFENLDINHSFNVLTVYKNTFADSIVLRSSTFQNISGAVLPLNRETEDVGIYNAEQVVIENCLFQEIGGTALDLYRGGRDESTFGPMLLIDHSTFIEVGHDKRNRSEAAINLHGVQLAHVGNSLFSETRPIDLHLIVGDPVVSFSHLNFAGMAKPLIDNGEPYQTTQITTLTETADIERLQGQDGNELGAPTSLQQ